LPVENCGRFAVHGALVLIPRQPTGRKSLVNIVVVLKRQAHLLQIVTALSHGGRFADSLHRRNEQRDENGNDRDDDQQFDQREG
jgi:hypothetical protein